MEPTPREIAAARQLGEAVLSFLLAHEEAARLRLTQAQPVRSGNGVDEQLLLTAEKVAEKLSICQKTLWRYTQPRGPLPAIRFGSAVRYHVKDVEAALAKFRDQPPPQTASSSLPVSSSDCP